MIKNFRVELPRMEFDIEAKDIDEAREITSENIHEWIDWSELSVQELS